MVGNLLPDFTKKIDGQAYSKELMQGVALHRFIDSFTDTHPLFHQSRRRISTERRRFSAVLVDIFYDHFLAIHWEDYNDRPLYESTRSFYRHLENAAMPLPANFAHAIERMPKIDLLFNYSTLRGMEHAVDRVAQRIRFENNLYGGVEELTENFSALQRDFHTFFAELKTAVDVYKRSAG